MLLGSMVKSSAIMVEKICSVQPKSVLLSIRLHTTAEDEQQSHVSIATCCFIIIIDFSSWCLSQVVGTQASIRLSHQTFYFSPAVAYLDLVLLSCWLSGCNCHLYIHGVQVITAPKLKTQSRMRPACIAHNQSGPPRALVR